MSVLANFRDDWLNFVRQVLDLWGHPVEAGETDQQLCHRMFNLEKRRISPQPRQVLLAAGFTCSAEHAVGWAALRAKLERGEDVTAHLSAKVLNAPDDADDLLNDWGVHHLHLGVNPHPKDARLIERTGPLLFVRVSPSHVYAIGIFEHGSWTKKEILEILNGNWPTVLHRHRLAGVVGVEYDPTEEERARLRAAGVNVITQLSDGTVLAPPGGGISTAGTSISVVMESDRHLREMDALEQRVRDNEPMLRQQIEARGRVATEPLRFKLHIDQDAWYAIEEGSRVAFKLRARS